MNEICDEIDRVLSHLTLADWCTRISYGVVGFSMVYLAGHLIAWWMR